MVDFKDYAWELQRNLNIETSEFNQILVKFLADNEWFGISPVWQNGKLMVNPDDFKPHYRTIQLFFEKKDLGIEEKNVILTSMLKRKFPDTESKISSFYEECEISEEIKYCITDFLVAFLKKEIFLMDDKDVESLLDIAFDELAKHYGNIVTEFLGWTKRKYRTKYFGDYFMAKRRDLSSVSEAYDMEAYLELLYRLFNEEYIISNDMYTKAAESKNYADTWIFLALHFICALRNTDIVRIHHPRLTMQPEEVLKRVVDGSFSDEDARLTLYSITWRLAVLPLTPNKTQKHNNIPSIKFCVPESVEVHIGTLLAIAEAHRLLGEIPDDHPLIRIISTYEQINRYMGDEIGILFLESNFRSRSANKSYLQSILMLTDDILGIDEEFNTKGYILAALARSHKGTYGEFATSTAIYLKDAKLNGLTPEYVAMELFERGVLSFIPSMLLKMITGGDYNKLPVRKQTKLIQDLNLSPQEVEDIVTLSNKTQSQSYKFIGEMVLSESNNKNTILNILHRIGNGTAVSKQNECMCLMAAMKKICPYSERSSCIGCNYEISTKSTVFLMMSEYKRLLNLYEKTNSNIMKEKYRSIVKETLLPIMDELLQCVKEQYGEDALKSLEKMIKESMNGKG